MLEAKAIKEIRKNGVVVGYRLRDAANSEMDVNSKAIVDAIKNKRISISNLKLTDDGQLMLIGSQTSDSVKPTSIKDEKKESLVKPVLEKKNSVTEQADVARMHELIKVLNNARKVYEQGTDEVMSNYKYDELYDELEALEHKLGTVMSNSPTINVGYEIVSDLPKKKHDSPMLSLDKTKDRDELVGFLGDKQGVLSWKLDGLTIVLTYINGKLAEAVTRGNGEIGEIVTPNAKQFKNIPHEIPFKGKLVLRGEATISYTTFKKINDTIALADEKYKNPRNLCSGSVRQQNSAITASRGVEWRCFEVVSAEGVNLSNYVTEQFKFADSLGFVTVDYMLVDRKSLKEAIDKFEEILKEHKMDVPSDGLVLTFNDKAYGKSLGRTAKYPRHSKAFKWKDETAETNLIDIDWQVGKTGKITPVAVFEPVDLEGSTVTKASLHNLSIMIDLLGQPYAGQSLKVFKANMIIPQVLEATKLSNTNAVRKIFIPGACPCCGCNTTVKEDPNSGVLTLWCTNPYCDARGNRLLKHFVSRDAMNIDGISGSTLEKLESAGIIDSYASIFRIQQHPEIMEMEGFGLTSFQNMVDAVNKARNVKLYNLIYALAIPNVGLQTAKLICKNFNNDLKATVTANYMSLAGIPGVGDVIATSFFEYFHDKEKVDEFLDLLKELNIIKEEVKQADANDPINGKTFCVTGSVYIFQNRNQIKDIIESHGGKLTGSVSKSTNYLVTNDTTSGSRKNKAAQEYNIPILTEQEFIDKFNLADEI